MVDLLDIPAPMKRKQPNLILHCGGHHVPLKEVESVTTPGSTETWTPIPHHQLIQTVQRTLTTTNLKIGTDDADAHDLIIRACDVGVMSNRLIPSVLHEWREPKHHEFQERDVWSLFNSFTEALKEGNLAELPKRTEALHGLLDVAVGLN